MVRRNGHDDGAEGQLRPNARRPRVHRLLALGEARLSTVEAGKQERLPRRPEGYGDQSEQNPIPGTKTPERLAIHGKENQQKSKDCEKFSEITHCIGTIKSSHVRNQNLNTKVKILDLTATSFFYIKKLL